MKFNKRLHDNCIEYFMVWTQICMVVYICSEMHKTFLQLLITNLTSHNLKMELCNITSCSQLGYPKGHSNKKKKLQRIILDFYYIYMII
jgi:hypothetical protein